MKRAVSWIVLVVLVVGVAGCSNTVTGPSYEGTQIEPGVDQPQCPANAIVDCHAPAP